MNLTEPQAGSDLAAVRTSAVPDGDAYRIFGNEDFHHLGRERRRRKHRPPRAGAPSRRAGGREGHFAVHRAEIPCQCRRLPRRAQRSRLRLHRAQARHPRLSPTAAMSFGEKDGAIGYLVGEPNRGLEYMFTMMNHARLNVGLEGVAISERAYQQARAYAHERVQGKPLGAAGRLADRLSSRRAAHAARHEGARSRPCARSPISPPARWIVAHRHPDAGGARAAAQATGRSADRRWSRAGARKTPSRSHRPASRFMAAWATSRRPAPRSIFATPASPRSTKAPPRSRPMIWSGARSRATAARRAKALVTTDRIRPHGLDNRRNRRSGRRARGAAGPFRRHGRLDRRHPNASARNAPRRPPCLCCI